MKKGSVFFAVFILAFALFFCFQSLTYENLKTKLLPLVVSVVTLLLAGANLVNELAKRPKGKEDEESAEGKKKANKKESLRFYMTYFGWSLGLVLGIYLLGFLISIPIFISLFLTLHGQKFLKSASIAVLTTAILYAVFVLVFKTELYEGIVIQMLV